MLWFTLPTYQNSKLSDQKTATLNIIDRVSNEIRRVNEISILSPTDS